TMEALRTTRSKEAWFDMAAIIDDRPRRLQRAPGRSVISLLADLHLHDVHLVRLDLDLLVTGLVAARHGDLGLSGRQAADADPVTAPGDVQLHDLLRLLHLHVRAGADRLLDDDLLLDVDSP